MSPEERLKALTELLDEEWDGEALPALKPGATVRDMCPHCGNGSHNENSFAITTTEDCMSVLWCCHRASCGWTGAKSLLGEHGVNRAYAAAAEQRGSNGGSAALGGFGGGGAYGGGGYSGGGGGGGAFPGRADLLAQLSRPGAAGRPRQPGPPGATGARQAPLGSGLSELSPELKRWLVEERGISEEVLAANRVMMERKFSPSANKEVDWLAFPYKRDGQVVNVKYRSLPKGWRQSRGGAKILYGYDDVKGDCDEVIIVEGELDKLALNTAGFQNVVSVPDGAPSRPHDGPLPSPQADTKFSYVHDCAAALAPPRRIVLATDNDPPGLALAHELARRLGRDRCYVVHWPTDRGSSLHPAARLQEEDADGGGAAAAAGAEAAAAPAPGPLPASPSSPAASRWFRKDANEVLVKDGPAALREYIAAAQPLPLTGLQRFGAFWEELYDLYAQDGAGGAAAAVETGWGSVDAFYKVSPGELTLVTGVPNSGKSEWLDALAVNLAARHGWRFALCSLENERLGHLVKLLEKRVGKPFSDGAGGRARMMWEEAVAGWQWVDEMFHRIVAPPGEQLPTVDFVLERAKILVLRFGIRGLIIDPYNELDHRRSNHVTETEFVSQMLTKMKRFAQHYDCHVWLVAHPRQLQDWKGEAPNLYDVSGSAHFINKADCGIVVHRPYGSGLSRGRPGPGGGDRQQQQQQEGGDPALVQVLVRKMRNKAAGRIGDTLLRYDRATGRYADEPQQ